MNYQKYYILAPYNFATGGVELSHQLVDYLRSKGKDAFVVFVANNEFVTQKDVHPAYSSYDIVVAEEIEDHSDNILIVPEVFIEFIRGFRNIHIGIWWMSVDKRYEYSCLLDQLCWNKNLIKRLKLIVNYILGRSYRYINSDKYLLSLGDRIVHFYQSRYAQYHLYSKGFSNILPLSDYINTQYLGSGIADKTDRKNVVLYNPLKGFSITRKLIEYMPQVDFIPLVGYSREQLWNLFKMSKVYIDFGEFPGKDRLFREASMGGCCIITGKSGASAFYEDVPIKACYKFARPLSQLREISEVIENILNNYDEHNANFDFLRMRILSEKEMFFNEVDRSLIN